MREPKYYFSSQSLVLQGVENVWDVLKRLPSYLEKVKLGEIRSKIPEGVFLENPHQIFIDENTLIEPGAYIKGPVWIGKGCEIRHGAYIRGNVILESGVIIGHCTEVKNSLLLENAHAAHFNYVGDSILGADSNIGAGVKCANVRLDRKNIQVQIDGKKVNTGLQKMGLILGDRSQIGCNSVPSPGTLIGQDVFCHPCQHIQGFIPSNANLKN